MKMTKQMVTVVGAILALAASGSGQTLQFLATKAEGDGAIQLRWQSETNAIYRIEYATALSNGVVWQTFVEGLISHGTNTTFLDTGRYWADPELKHPALNAQRYYRVAKAGTNSLPPPVVSLSSPTAGAVLSGEVTITASAVSTNNVSSIKFYVDGEEVEEIGQPDSGTISYQHNRMAQRPA